MWLPLILEVGSLGPDQIACINKLILAFAVHVWHKAPFPTCNLKYMYITVSDLSNQTIQPTHDKTYKIACVPSKDSDQPGHLPSLIRGFAVCSIGS